MPDPDDDLQDLDDIEEMGDDELDKLVDSIVGGEGGDDDGDGDQKPQDADATTPQSPTAGTSPLTGQALLDAFAHDPEAQRVVKSQLDAWASSNAANAALQKEQEEFNELLRTGNFDEIGRRFVTQESERKIKDAARDEALKQTYTQVYGRIFQQPELQTLTEEEKDKLNPDKFQSDEDYVVALTDFIADKRGGKGLNDVVEAKVNEKLETLRNMKSAKSATAASPSAVPGAVQAASNGKQTSRSLISEGFAEAMEERAGERVMA